MSEHEYHVVADRSKGDDPQRKRDALPGDRITTQYVIGEIDDFHPYGRAGDTVIVRIERPVPTTTDKHEPINTANIGYYRTQVQCSCGGSWWFGKHEGDPTHDEAKAQHEHPSPSLPTREQIAALIEELNDAAMKVVADDEPVDDEPGLLREAARVLALLQKEAER